MTNDKPAIMLRQPLQAVCLMVLFFLVGVLPTFAASLLEQAVLQEMNAARTAPLSFVDHLQRHRALFAGKRYQPPGANYFITSREGTAAIDEAIAFLKSQRSLPPLVWEEGLARSAAELVWDQGKSGKTGHDRGKLAMAARIGRNLKWTGSIGENIAYGPGDGRDVVLQLIVDDGVPGRGHRANIFSSDFRLTGVACGPHPKLRTVCVIDFAGGASK